MKNQLKAAVVLSLLATAAWAGDPTTGPGKVSEDRYEAQVKLLAQKYVQEVRAAQKEFDTKVEQLRNDCIATLKKQMDDETKKGNLDGALQLRDRITQLREQTRTTYPEVSSVDDQKWQLCYKSTNPEDWGKDVNEKGRFAKKLEKASAGTRYLKMAVGDDYVIVPITKAQLKKQVEGEDYGWVGDSRKGWNATMLGIYRKQWNKQERGQVDVLALGGKGYSGWGYGVRVLVDDKQGMVWNGDQVDTQEMEISITDKELSTNERKFLLGYQPKDSGLATGNTGE